MGRIGIDQISESVKRPSKAQWVLSRIFLPKCCLNCRGYYFKTCSFLNLVKAVIPKLAREENFLLHGCSQWE